MAAEANDSSAVEYVSDIELRWMDPDEFAESRLYNDDPGRGTTHLRKSIQAIGIQEPVLGRIEDGHVAFFDGGRRVDGAKRAGEKVPVWIPKDGSWTDGRILLTRLLANTGALEEDTDWLRRAWLIEDWWEEVGNTETPPVRDISAELGISKATASRWLEPLHSRWNRTIIDRDMFDGEHIFQPETSDTELIGGLHINDIIENVKPPRLKDIKLIVKHSVHIERDHAVRAKLLNSYVENDITYKELKELKNKVENNEIAAFDALQEIRQEEIKSVETNLEGDVAQMVSVLAEQSGKDESEIIEQGAEEICEREDVEVPGDEPETEEVTGQFDYLHRHVDGSLPVPDLRMTSNEHMENLPTQSIHITVTSPPYNIDWEYGAGYDDNKLYHEKYLPEVIADTFRRVYQITVDGGYCCIVVPKIVDVSRPEWDIPKGTLMAGDIEKVLTGSWNPQANHTIRKLQTETEWKVKNIVTWWKGYNDAGLRDQYGTYPELHLNNFVEDILVLKKPGQRKVSDQIKEQSKIIWQNKIGDNDLRENHWRISPATWESEYTDSTTAVFPEELAKRCIMLWSYVGDTVLDPFAGRGTTLKMAKRLYRESIGYEIQDALERDINEYLGID